MVTNCVDDKADFIKNSVQITARDVDSLPWWSMEKGERIFTKKTNANFANVSFSDYVSKYFLSRLFHLHYWSISLGMEIENYSDEWSLTNHASTLRWLHANVCDI